MTQQWDEMAAGWDADEAVHVYAARALASFDAHVVPAGLDLASARVLDFGSGTGRADRRVRAALRARRVALDSSAKMIEVLTAKLRERDVRNVSAIAAELTAQLAARHAALQQPFELIVASSVCAFLDDYPATLAVLADLLAIDGLFVQWDWLPSADEPTFGFTGEAMASAYAEAGLEVLRAEPTFELEAKAGAMPVVMGVARKRRS